MSDPKDLMVRDRNALEVLCFAFLGALVTPGAFGLQPLPPSLQQAQTLGHAAGVALVVGCAVGILGVAWRDHDQSLLIEQVGVGFVCIASVGYVVALCFATTFASAAWALGTTLGIAAFCGWRFIQIQSYIRHRRLGGRPGRRGDP